MYVFKCACVFVNLWICICVCVVYSNNVTIFRSLKRNSVIEIWMHLVHFIPHVLGIIVLSKTFSLYSPHFVDSTLYYPYDRPQYFCHNHCWTKCFQSMVAVTHCNKMSGKKSHYLFLRGKSLAYTWHFPRAILNYFSDVYCFVHTTLNFFAM